VAESDKKEVNPPDHIERILELVRDYGAAVRVQGTGPEVAEKYRAVVEALRKGAQRGA
jgi:ABC-type hemin transport system substrate-binding protein